MPNCRSCGAEIVWVNNVRSGKAMPLNAEPDLLKGNVLAVDGIGDALDAKVAAEARSKGVNLHLSHFATCVDSKKFRRAK
jgi:hypothetical protein